tara:strand:- start:92 stop:373 length:282 start_codon:yes stop_codon:yes gene_type:complete
MNDNDTTYIDRMEQEFKENSERYIKGQAYLDKLRYEECQPLYSKSEEVNEPTKDSRLSSFESEQLHEQMYSMNNYLKVLGSRIMFAKAKEGLL